MRARDGKEKISHLWFDLRQKLTWLPQFPLLSDSTSSVTSYHMVSLSFEISKVVWGFSITEKGYGVPLPLKDDVMLTRYFIGWLTSAFILACVSFYPCSRQLIYKKVCSDFLRSEKLTNKICRTVWMDQSEGRNLYHLTTMMAEAQNIN